MRLRDNAQELRELGARGTLFRIGWELRLKAGMTSVRPSRAPAGEPEPSADWTYRLQLEDPVSLARTMREHISDSRLDELKQRAERATHGTVQCFSRWPADFGDPVDWHRDPLSGRRFDQRAPWFRALTEEARDDVKNVWELGRFPHAYHLARAGAFFPDDAPRYAEALALQLESFILRNPVGFGVHWASGQEVGFRLLAWIFALDVLLSRTDAGKRIEPLIAQGLIQGARHIEDHLDYARIAVYNNHLLSEALALYAGGALIPDSAEGRRWRERGRSILDAEAERQFYPDGSYIQQSHNYHRVALQNYMWAASFVRSTGDSPSASWLKALERSLEFLLAHQNPGDGRLPNYGSNDGALPSLLTTCDFSDFRPILQCVSLLVRGERLYEHGPWDETAAWFLGVRALDAPMRPPRRASVSFRASGYHVLRGADPSTFAAFRCGTLRDRFSQIDMLHLDVWWKGENVLVDPGSYRYNAAPDWHRHFMGTASHNTVTVDGHDQMLHFRQFKVLYWTRASLLRHHDDPAWTVSEGEHYGFRRHPGGVVHRRAILHVKDGLWIVVDRVTGSGTHRVRLHWLCGRFPWAAPVTGNGLSLETPQGAFDVRIYDSEARPMAADVVEGSERPPRGWLSRYYGERVAVPSIAVERDAGLPFETVTILAGMPVDVARQDGSWTIEAGSRTVTFALAGGRFDRIAVRG